MADTTFVDGVTLTAADWFNDVNDLAYTSVGITPGSPPASKAALIYLLINGMSADAAPDQEADYVATLDASATTGKKVLLNKISGFKVGAFTRDLSAATGTVAYTGVGAKPRMLMFLAGFSVSADKASIGIDNGTTKAALYNHNVISAGRWLLTQSYSIVAEESVSDSHAGIVSALGSDGFSIDYTKTGSPSGTMDITYLAMW